MDDKPPPAPAPPGRIWPLLRTSANLIVLAVVPLFVIFANTQFKDLFDRFTGGCTFVIQKEAVKTGQIQVTAWLTGLPPKQLPLMFAGRDATINTILFDDPYRRDRIQEPDDLSFHPMTNASCPGTLCETSGDQPFRDQALVVLTDLRPEFKYRFNVRMLADAGQPALGTGHLKVYALFDAGLDGGICKVQPRRWFNFWVWAGPMQKCLLFLCLIVVSGLLLKWANLPKE